MHDVILRSIALIVVVHLLLMAWCHAICLYSIKQSSTPFIVTPRVEESHQYRTKSDRNPSYITLNKFHTWPTVPVGVATHSLCGIPVNADGDIPARARLLKGHTVVALADPNPEDPNSALLTHIQVNLILYWCYLRYLWHPLGNSFRSMSIFVHLMDTQ